MLPPLPPTQVMLDADRILERTLIQKKLIDDLYLKYSRQVRGKGNQDDTVYNELKEAQRHLRELEMELEDMQEDNV